MKKTTSNILFIALMALLLFSLSGCAQEKEENTEENDPQAREAVLQCCELIFGSAEETGNYHIRVTDERDGGRVDEYDCPRGAATSRGMRQRSRIGTIAAMGSLRRFLMGKMRSRSFRPGER